MTGYPAADWLPSDPIPEWLYRCLAVLCWWGFVGVKLWYHEHPLPAGPGIGAQTWDEEEQEAVRR